MDKLIKKGFFHCLVVMVLVMATFFVTARILNFSASTAEAIAALCYVLAVGRLGYIWKKRNGQTFSLDDREANKNLFRYAFGAAIVLVTFILPQILKISLPAGPWWPLVCFIAVPFGLFAQTANFSMLIVLGGWFYRE